VSAAKVHEVIEDAAGELLASLRLFDVYRGEGVEAGQRSLAFTLRLQADDRTLTDAAGAEVRQRVIDAVESSLPAHLRA
jgi:phenylalanyl-tRNA synthetase beta chain